MHTFTNNRDGFNQVRKRILVSLIPFYAVLLFGMAYLMPSRDGSSAEATIITMAMVIVIFAFTTVSTVKKQKRVYETYKLTITDHSIVREQHDTPLITIDKGQIREIQKWSNGALSIIADSKLNMIGIPSQIERRDELERLLTEIKPLTTKNYGMWMVWLQVVPMVIILGICARWMVSEDRILSSISGIAMCVLLIAGFVVIQRSKNLDRRLKRLSYITVIPVLAIISNIIMSWINE